MHVVDQVLSIYAGNGGHLDKVPRSQVAQWEKEFLDFMREQKSEIRSKIMESKDLSDDTEKLLDAAIGDFQKQWAAARAKEAEKK
jgi:F-type H+-transporting ATPase subunit alpha